MSNTKKATFPVAKPQDLEHIEQLLHQSLRGHHHLFPNEKISGVLSKQRDDSEFFSFENMDKVQKLFSDLVSRKSVANKLEYLNALDADSYEILLRTYFNLLESTILQTGEHKH